LLKNLYAASGYLVKACWSSLNYYINGTVFLENKLRAPGGSFLTYKTKNQ